VNRKTKKEMEKNDKAKTYNSGTDFKRIQTSSRKQNSLALFNGGPSQAW
jgi:hypothetical protein